MRKLILASAAMVAFSGAAFAGDSHHYNSSPTGTVSGQFDYTKTYTNFDRYTNTQTHNEYNGFQGFTSSEHGGGVEVKSNYNGQASGVSQNYSVSNFKGAEINGNVQVGSFPFGLSASGQLRGLSADSMSSSGGTVQASSAYGGSASVKAGGYAAGGAGARNETGWNNSQSGNHEWGSSTNWNGSGSITAAR